MHKMTAMARQYAPTQWLAITLAVTLTTQAAKPATAHAASVGASHHKVQSEEANTRAHTFTPPLPTVKHIRAAQWNFSAFVHFGPTTFLPHGVDNNCATNATTNVTAPIASVELFDPTAVSGLACTPPMHDCANSNDAPLPCMMQACGHLYLWPAPCGA
jgi:hypothetical protein